MSETQMAPPEPPGSAALGTVPGWAAWTLRILVLLTAVFTVLQPVYAGQLLAGTSGAHGMHAAGHAVIGGLLFFQIVAAVLVWRPGRGPAWPIWASVGFLVYIEIQAGFGFVRMLALHIPLGVVAVGMSVLFVVLTWSPRLRVKRSAPRVRSVQ